MIYAELKIELLAFLISDLAFDGSQVSDLVFRSAADDVAGVVAEEVKAGAVQDEDVVGEEGVIFVKLKEGPCNYTNN